MRFAKFFSRRNRSSESSPEALRAIARAVRPSIEALEVRQLLTTVTIPASAHAVDLRPGHGGQGDIFVYVDTQVDPVGEFTSPYGTDIIDCNGASVTCTDDVPAAIKPQSAYGGSIQFINGGSGSTLQLNAGFSDRLIQVTNSTSAGTTVKTTDAAETAAGTDGYDGTFSHLTLRTNDDATPTDYDYHQQLDNVYGTRVYVPTLYGDGALTVETGLGTYDTIELGGGGTSATDPSTVTNARVITGAGRDRVLVSDKTDAAPSGLDQPSATVDFGIGTGVGTGDDHYLGLENELAFGCGGQATIRDLANDGHTVVVDQVESQFTVGFDGPSMEDPQPSGSVTVASASAIRHLSVSGENDATLDAANTYVDILELQGAAAVSAPARIDTITPTNSYGFGGSKQITFAAGSGSSSVGAVEPAATVPSPTPAINVSVEAGASVTFGTGTIAGPLSFYSLTTAGTVDLSRATTITTLNLSGGRVTLDQGGTWRTAPLANTVDTLNLTGGLLDLHGQDVVTQNLTAAQVRALVASAYDGGAWDGTTGILSSYAPNATSTYAVGFATSNDNATTGLSLSSGQVLLRPTVAGDATLDGHTTIADPSSWNNNYATGNEWAQGDLDYSGTVNIADLSVWNNDYADSF